MSFSNFCKPVIRFTSQLNGYTALCLTKTDILDKLDEVKIGVAYLKVAYFGQNREDNLVNDALLKDGKKLDHYPSGIFQFDGLSVEYITMPGWKTSIADCRSFDDLPVNCKNYILKAQELLGKNWNITVDSKGAEKRTISFKIGQNNIFSHHQAFPSSGLELDLPATP